ncbi:MAG: cation transporter, partial [Bacteroidota bacterium]
MTCASCVTRVEKTLLKIEGVSNASVNLATEKVSLSFDTTRTSLDALAQAVRESGYQLVLPSKEPNSPVTSIDPSEEPRAELRRDLILSVALALPIMAVSMLMMLPSFHDWFPL